MTRQELIAKLVAEAQDEVRNCEASVAPGGFNYRNWEDAQRSWKYAQSRVGVARARLAAVEALARDEQKASGQ